MMLASIAEREQYRRSKFAAAWMGQALHHQKGPWPKQLVVLRAVMAAVMMFTMI
jgi:hypothetical protein